jgi:ligand-binding sensor domain-containing protein
MIPRLPLLITRWLLKCLLFTFFLAGQPMVNAQAPTFNFRHLTTANGLSDGIVRSLVQDHYGFMWIGTSYGLNRFDGINIKSFFSKPTDSTTLDNNFIQTLYCDSKKNLWVGTLNGLCRYDYISNRFIRYTAPGSVIINGIQEDKKGRIWLATTYGLWIVDDQKLTIQKFVAGTDTVTTKKLQVYIQQIISAPDGTWYLATTMGVKIFNPLTYAFDEIRHNPGNKFSLSGDVIVSVALDNEGNLWASCRYNESILNKIDLKNHTVKYFNRFTDPVKKWSANAISRIIIDKQGRLWISSSMSGLSMYNKEKDDFTDYNKDPFIPNSLLANHTIIPYQDKEGVIWVGTAGYGVSYFNPDKNLFNYIYPVVEKNYVLSDIWSRAACEDRQGNLWLATGKGVSEYDARMKHITTLTNTEGEKPVIHFNSVRSLLEDDHGDIWIGTTQGLNRYHPATGGMDFFDEKQGIPRAFFWMMAKDQKGVVWLGSTYGLYRYNREENRFDDLSHDSLFAKYAHRNVQALFADSHDRLWVGLLDIGVTMFDPGNKKLRLLTIRDSLISDTRISSFAEDRDGLIWIGSEDGLNAYDPVKNKTRFFTREDGLPSTRTNNLMVDSLNRLWIGTSNSLCMLNARRDKMKKFDVNDGLLTNQFNEQSAYRTRKGLFIYPTYKGFVVFHPEEYQENVSAIPVYITSFTIAGKKNIPYTENLRQINLRYNENFFSFELAGLSYMNPYKVRYAYKLEPFDKEWIYTAKREVNYTNVPAGNYVFRYKAITDNLDWDVPEKSVRISINSVFYKTGWFKLAAILLLAFGVITFYRYRIRHKENILKLKAKAQLLEKEKALVMYESLKQHLNPHFLFNSLTSLRSLIKTDSKTATHFLDGLSRVYRYVLRSGEQELVLLQDELEFVQTFTELQKIRFGEGLMINIHADAAYYHKRIVPVTLQNLVENAIKHNTASTDNPLVVEIFTADDHLVVRNNLQRYRIVETSNKRGLASLQSLYHYFSGQGIKIEEDEHYFTVKIPLI